MRAGSGRRTALTLLLLAAMTLPFFYRLGAWPLFDPDEGRNAEVAREMAASGQWAVPRFDGQPYLDKPVLLFWAVAAVFRLRGVGEASARLPSALAAVATTALTLASARLLLGPAQGLLAASIVATSPLVLAFARLVIFDMLLTALVTAALYCLLRARLGGAPARWLPAAGTAGAGGGRRRGGARGSGGGRAVARVRPPQRAWLSPLRARRRDVAPSHLERTLSSRGARLLLPRNPRLGARPVARDAARGRTGSRAPLARGRRRRAGHRVCRARHGRRGRLLHARGVQAALLPPADRHAPRHTRHGGHRRRGRPSRGGAARLCPLDGRRRRGGRRGSAARLSHSGRRILRRDTGRGDGGGGVPRDLGCGHRRGGAHAARGHRLLRAVRSGSRPRAPASARRLCGGALAAGARGAYRTRGRRRVLRGLPAGAALLSRPAAAAAERYGSRAHQQLRRRAPPPPRRAWDARPLERARGRARAPAAAVGAHHALGAAPARAARGPARCSPVRRPPQRARLSRGLRRAGRRSAGGRGRLTTERPLDGRGEPPRERVAVGAHAARHPVGEQHLVDGREQLGEVARLLVDEHPSGRAAAEDLRLQVVDLLPVAHPRLRARGAQHPRRPRAQVHAQEGRVGDEVIDVERDQRLERIAGRKRPARDLGDEIPQLPPPLLQQGAVKVRLAREDGVDRAHREAGAGGDLLQARRLEPALGEDLLGRLEHVLAVDVAARLARLFTGRGAGHQARSSIIRKIS